MLYISTRNKTDHYTANRALLEDRAPDGGYYLPFRLSAFSEEQIEQIKTHSFGEAVAQVLNLFFSSGLSAWDVDCCIGKTPIKTIPVSHRVLLNELWHNPKGSYSYISHMLYHKLCGDQTPEKLSDWADVSIRIAILFGIYSVLAKAGITDFDICVNIGDFTSPVAAWYAKKMGAPIRNIICAANENSGSWDLLHRGEMNMGNNVVHTAVPALDYAIPFGVERLIFEKLGYDEANRFVGCMNRRGMYHIRPDLLEELNESFFVSVIGNDRIESVINSTYRSCGFILDPYAAVSFGSLQDYRAKVGESRLTVLLCENTPAQFSQVISKATGLSTDEILGRIQ